MNRVPTRTNDRRREHERSRPEPWRNTRPRGNPEPHRQDLERSIERMEMLLGR